MAIDASIPLQIQQQKPFNPLESALNVQQYQSNMLRNKLLQGQMDSDVAVGNALKSAMSADGTVNQSAFWQSIKGDPRATMGLAQAAQQNATLRGTDIGNQSSQFQQNVARQQWGAQSIARVASNPNATSADLLKELQSGIQNGYLTPQAAMQVAASAPGADAGPGAIQSWAKGLVQQFGTPAQLQQYTPSVQLYNNGGQDMFLDANPNTNPGIIGSKFMRTVSPETAVAQTQTMVNGQPGSISNASLGSQQGMGHLFAGGSGNGGINATGLPVGAAEMVKGSTDRYTALQGQIPQAKNIIHGLQDAATMVQGAIATGKGSVPLSNYRQVMQTYATALGIQLSGDQVKDQQLLQQRLASATDQAIQAMGMSGSDARANMARAAFPDPSQMNGPALLDSIKYNIGLQSGVVNKAQAMQSYLSRNGQNPVGLANFEAAYNRAFDPQVAYIMSLPQQQQAQEVAHLRATGQYDTFRKSYIEMKQVGAY